MSIEQSLMTVEAFEAFVNLPENADHAYELINGEIVEKVPTEYHAIIAGIIITEINLYLRRNKIGRAGVEPRHRAPDDPHNSRVPDVAFTSNERALPVTTEGAVPQMPDLAVEIQSPGQSDRLMVDKAAYYLANGSRMVWLIYPDKKLVEVLTNDDRQLLVEADTLDGGDVLPGFSLAVKTIFDV